MEGGLQGFKGPCQCQFTFFLPLSLPHAYVSDVSSGLLPLLEMPCSLP